MGSTLRQALLGAALLLGAGCSTQSPAEVGAAVAPLPSGWRLPEGGHTESTSRHGRGGATVVSYDRSLDDVLAQLDTGPAWSRILDDVSPKGRRQRHYAAGPSRATLSAWRESGRTVVVITWEAP
jgi:hypothetical protein